MQSTVRLSAAGLHDAPGIARVHVASWRTGYRGLIRQTVLDHLHVPDTAERWRGTLLAGDRHVTVAHAPDGQVVGFCVCTDHPEEKVAPAPISEGEVEALYVAPGRWRGGVGGALLEEAEAFLARMECGTAELWVLRGNARARAFYEARGWHWDGGERPWTSPRLSVPSVRYVRALDDLTA